MPYSIRKVHGKNCYLVESRKIHSKCTSIEKAKRQVRLLQAIEHGYSPKSKKQSKKRSKKQSKKRSTKRGKKRSR